MTVFTKSRGNRYLRLMFLSWGGHNRCRVFWNRYNSKTETSLHLCLRSIQNLGISATESSYVHKVCLEGGKKNETKNPEAQDARSFSKEDVSKGLQQQVLAAWEGRRHDLTRSHQSTAVHTTAEDNGGGGAPTGLYNLKKKSVLNEIIITQTHLRIYDNLQSKTPL